MSKETRQNLEANINEATLETQASLEQALLAAYPPASEKWVDQVAARQTAAATARMEAAYEAAAIMGEYEAEESLEIWKNQALPEPLPTILASEWMTEWWDMSDWVLRGDQLEDPEAIAEMRAEMIEQAENRVERMAWDWVMRFIFDTGGDKEASLTVADFKEAFKSQDSMLDIDPYVLTWEKVEEAMIGLAPSSLAPKRIGGSAAWAVELKEAGRLTD